MVMNSPPVKEANAISAGAATFRFLLAWGIVLVLLGLANRTRLGHVLIYYTLSLMILFLVLTQYQWFANVLQPAAFSPPEPSNGNSSSGSNSKNAAQSAAS